MNNSLSPLSRHVGAVATQSEMPAAVNVSAPQPLEGRFPNLEFGSSAVNAAEHVAAGTSWRVMLGSVLAVVMLLVATVASAGGFLIVLAIGAVLTWFQSRRVRALIHGQAVRIDTRQLPALDACIQSFSKRLNLKHVPDVYMLEDGAVNGFALKLAGKEMMILTDDAVWGSLQSKNPRALGFIVGHELAHAALGHTGYFRGMVRTIFPPLRRIDELSADNVARELVGDVQVAYEGVKLLTVGPQMSHYINDEALRAQAASVVANKLSAKVEKTMTHPLLLRRIHNVMA